ncbi:MAG: phage terminase large subunit, partial [Evtepia sp.]
WFKRKEKGITTATEDKKDIRPQDGPAYTAGILMGKRRNGRFVVADVFNQRLNAADVQAAILNTAKSDKAIYKRVKIRLNQDPGQAGKAQAEQYMKLLQGFSISIRRETGSKETRAEPFSAQWLGVRGSEMGHVDILLAPWNEVYFSQLESFPESKFKDMVDSSATAFDELTLGATACSISETESDRHSPWI